MDRYLDKYINKCLKPEVFLFFIHRNICGDDRENYESSFDRLYFNIQYIIPETQ